MKRGPASRPARRDKKDVAVRGKDTIRERRAGNMDCVVGLAPVARLTRRVRAGDGTAKRRKEGVAPVSATNAVHMVPHPPAYVGVDLHRDTLQFAVVDPEGNVISNTKVRNDRASIKRACAGIPKGAWYVVESSSVWHGVYMLMTAELGLDLIVANPRQVRSIALSKKKTDENDAVMLAQLLRLGHIPAVYVPSHEAIRNRQLVRHRHALGAKRTYFKNKIHGILLQEGIRIKDYPFTKAYVASLRKLGDYRIDAYLDVIDHLSGPIKEADTRIGRAANADRYARLLLTVPGIGAYTALAISSSIEVIDRFPTSDALVSYFGLAPSVRDSAGVQHHGHITKAGDGLVRHLIVEAVVTHARYAKESTITKLYNRLRGRKGAAKARVAAATRMVRTAFWMIKEDRGFSDEPPPPPAPGKRGCRT